MTPGQLSWNLAMIRLRAVRRRIDREGLTRPVGDAFTETLAALSAAAVELNMERHATVAEVRG